MVAMQHAELATSFDGVAGLLTEDYAHNLDEPAEFDLARLHNFSTEELFSGQLVAQRLGFGSNPPMEQLLTTRGVRLLTMVGRLPSPLVAKLVDRFTLQELSGAPVSSLLEVEGIGQLRARQIRDAMLRIAEIT